MRDVKSIGHAAGGLVAQTLVTLADGDHTPSYVGIGRKTPGGKLDLVMFEDGLDGAKHLVLDVTAEPEPETPAEDVESEVAAEPKRRGRPPKSTEETTEVAPTEE